MPRDKPNITEVAFFTCGFLIILLGWVADLLGVFAFDGEPTDHGSASTLPLRLFLTMFGVAFATIGVAYENFPHIFTDGEMAKRYLVAFLFLADGSLHLYALNDHLAGNAYTAAFFVVFTTVQLAAAFVIPYTRRRLDPAWLAITAFLIAAYVATRTMSVWPIGEVEALDPLGIVSKIVEVLTILLLLSLVQETRVARRQVAGSVPSPER